MDSPQSHVYLSTLVNIPFFIQGKTPLHRFVWRFTVFLTNDALGTEAKKNLAAEDLFSCMEHLITKGGNVNQGNEKVSLNFMNYFLSAMSWNAYSTDQNPIEVQSDT